MENVIHSQRGFELVNADVTNHCNARCFFCFNDWDHFRPCNMSIETFQKLLTLLPLTSGRDFLLSCWFEPTINPDFFQMLCLLPAEEKDKIYFTTNLVKAIDDSDMEKMCAANVDHVNISIETYDPEKYVSITGVHKTHFFENLEKLAKYKEKYNTDIHVITMLTQRNKEELLSIIRHTDDLLHPSVHEIRTPYFFVEDTGTKEKLIKEMLTEEEIGTIRGEAASFGYTHLVWDTQFTKERFMEMESNHQLHYDATDGIKYRLRVSADGTARIGHQKKGKLIDLNSTDDPASLVRKELVLLQKKDAEEWRIREEHLHIKKSISDAPHNLDSAELFDERFLLLKGWSADFPGCGSEKERILYVRAGDSGRLYRLRTCQRPDVADAFGKPELADSGYSALIDLHGLENRYFSIYTGIKEEKNITLLQLVFEGNKEKAVETDRKDHLKKTINRVSAGMDKIRSRITAKRKDD